MFERVLTYARTLRRGDTSQPSPPPHTHTVARSLLVLRLHRQVPDMDDDDDFLPDPGELDDDHSQWNDDNIVDDTAMDEQSCAESCYGRKPRSGCC